MHTGIVKIMKLIVNRIVKVYTLIIDYLYIAFLGVIGFMQYLFLRLSHYLAFALFIGILLISRNLPVYDLQQFLSVYSVYLLEAVFILFIALFFLNIKYFRAILKKIEARYKVLVLVVAIAGILLASFMAPRVHRIYYDEDIYNNIGQCIADGRKAVLCNEGYYENNILRIVQGEYNKQPQGYPYLTSVVFRLFGTNELFIFILNNILLGLAAVVLFFIVFLLFTDVFAALTASLAYILIPVNLHWFNTCAVEPSTAFFMTLTILTLLVYIKNRKPVTLFLFITTFAFTLNFRPESVLLVLVIEFILLLNESYIWTKKTRLKDTIIFTNINRKNLKFSYIAWVVLFLLASGFILHLFSVWDNSWGASGEKLSMNDFNRNLFTNSIFYINNLKFPILFTLFAVIGLIFYDNRHYIKEKLIVLLWFLLFWGVFLFFYAGSYEYGQDIRFSLLSFAPLSALIGLGTSSVRNLLKKRFRAISAVLLALIVFSFTWFIPFVRSIGDEAWAARTDHRYAVEFTGLLPPNSLVLTHNPNIFLLHKQSAVQSSVETYNPGIIESYLAGFKGGVYVHFNYWSNVDDPVQRSYTENILNAYNWQVIREYRYRNYQYGLYKIMGKL
ncbi:MAG: glycosyltransferase family 39 protein [Spirochaetales bacterium]|nr:glycosyltransferase family 39 protein [Spirochaetales bacterium]